MSIVSSSIARNVSSMHDEASEPIKYNFLTGIKSRKVHFLSFSSLFRFFFQYTQDTMDIHLPVIIPTYKLEIYESIGVKLTLPLNIGKVKCKAITQDKETVNFLLAKLNARPFEPFKVFGM